MKNLTILILCFFYTKATLSQAGIWTWMKGDSTYQSVSSSEPRSCYACAHWTDTSGNFWIYTSSDLWKYDPVQNSWTAMCGISNDTLRIVAAKGIFNPQNSPGYQSHCGFTWTTPDNNLWMYGSASGGLAVFWKYSTAFNQWAWMGTFSPLNYGTKGVPDITNMPGGRQESNSAWVDNSGNLWFFGGGDFTNDMWKYDVVTGIWTWMSGSNNLNDLGQYGTMGVPSVNNYPSARWTNFFWKDDEGKFWVGLGKNAFSATDIWKFNPQTLEWTWMSGSPDVGICTPIGETCDTGSLYQAGARFENRTTWKISDELILTYCGVDCVDGGGINDLWAYLPFKNNWIRLGNYSSPGHYGVKGVSSTIDYPMVRSGAAGFKDRNNNCWAFSGYYIGNDLWRYEIDWSCLSPYISRVENLEDEIDVTIYPNPVDNELNVCLHDLQADKMRFFNMQGQLVSEIKDLVGKRIDISNLSKGVYIVEIELKETIIWKRLVKM